MSRGPLVPVAGGLVAVGASLLAMRTPALAGVDRTASRLLARDDLGDAVDATIAAATDLGSVYAILGAAGTLVAGGRTDRAVEVAAAGLAAWTVGQAAKGPVRRPRPYQADGARRLVHEPAGTSWPSGHAAVAGAIAVAAWPSAQPSRRPVVAALPAFVAVSRVYVGVHYVTDVLAGVGIGVATGAVTRAGVQEARRRWAERRP